MVKIKLKKGFNYSIPSSDDIISKYLDDYGFIFNRYRLQYQDLPNDTFLSDYMYCFYLTCKQYHPMDELFKEAFILKLEAQLKLSEQEDIKWR